MKYFDKSTMKKYGLKKAIGIKLGNHAIDLLWEANYTLMNYCPGSFGYELAELKVKLAELYIEIAKIFDDRLREGDK